MAHAELNSRKLRLSCVLPVLQNNNELEQVRMAQHLQGTQSSTANLLSSTFVQYVAAMVVMMHHALLWGRYVVLPILASALTFLSSQVIYCCATGPHVAMRWPWL